jgi:hypothetical protein
MSYFCGNTKFLYRLNLIFTHASRDEKAFIYFNLISFLLVEIAQIIHQSAFFEPGAITCFIKIFIIMKNCILFCRSMNCTKNVLVDRMI